MDPSTCNACRTNPFEAFVRTRRMSFELPSIARSFHWQLESNSCWLFRSLRSTSDDGATSRRTIEANFLVKICRLANLRVAHQGKWESMLAFEHLRLLTEAWDNQQVLDKASRIEFLSTQALTGCTVNREAETNEINKLVRKCCCSTYRRCFNLTNYFTSIVPVVRVRQVMVDKRWRTRW